MDKKFIISDAKVLDERLGIVEAYVNTMGVRDYDGDVIDPNAFNSSLVEPIHIPVLAGHDHGSIVGKVLEAHPHHIGGEEYKLFARMQMNLETQGGREAFSNIAGGFIREWSVGFNIPSADAVVYERGGKKAIRRINELDWVEVSSVIRGASPATGTIAAKSAGMDYVVGGFFVPEEFINQIVHDPGVPGSVTRPLCNVIRVGSKDGSVIRGASPATGTIAAKSADMDTEEKPYPNEHACRMREPGDFEIFRNREEEADGKTIRVIYGQEKGTDKWDIQSYRMPTSDWSEAEARGYCSDHDGIKFEPATGEDSEYEAAAASSTSDNDALDTVKAKLRLLELRLKLSETK